MKKHICVLFLNLFLLHSLNAQRTPVEYKFLTGNEEFPGKENLISAINLRDDNFPPLSLSNQLTVTFQQTGIFTTYDVQSNGVPNQLWIDPLIPTNIHAVVMSSHSPSLSPRYSEYLLSDDGGYTWFDMGQVPSKVNSGFPSISGLSTGSAVIVNYNNLNSTSERTKIYVDLGPGIGAFIEYDPGSISTENPIWPFALGIGSNKILFTALAGEAYTNILNMPGNFTGYQSYSSESPNGYWLARAENGLVGHAYIGSGSNIHDLFYRVSTDDGLSWSNSIKIWDWNTLTDSLGVLSGISMVFLNDNPYIAFNTMPLTETGFFPQRPSQIRVWSPAVNSGIPLIIADSSNIPFYPNTGIVSDGFTPVCRPAIGKSNQANTLVIAFSASTKYISEIDSSRYYSCWLTESRDGGISWNYPEKITPVVPLRDWRYISISPQLSYTSGFFHGNLLVQADSIAGSYVHGAPMGYAQLMGIKFLPPISINNISGEIPSGYNLFQNYPNPFNPATKIRFDLPAPGNIILTVHDITGRIVTSLIKGDELNAGTYEVEFNAGDLTSGVYFYTLQAGSYMETKKMLLVK